VQPAWLWFNNQFIDTGNHGRWQWGGGLWPPWIFIHGTNIVDRGLKVLFFGVFLLFFGLFSVAPLLVCFFFALFWFFLWFFVFLCPPPPPPSPGNFSADAPVGN